MDDKLKNYRIIIYDYHDLKIDYKNNFEDCVKYYPLIEEIVKILLEYNIKDIWWFFEPYLEITWMAENNNLEYILDEYLRNKKIKYKVINKDKFFADWYGDNPRELEFGWKTYSISSLLAFTFFTYNDDIKNGKGIDNQYIRRCHVLANQLGINYKKEGWILFKRSILCWLFWFLGHKKAVWIYTKILRQKY